jgi:hypothetical protein
MISTLLSWLRPPTAPPPDLEAQLTAARAACESATAAVASAQAAFDADGGTDTLAALTSARDAERACAEHVARAQRLLDAAREREAAAARVELEQQVSELERQLDERASNGDAPLLQREIDAWLAVVAAREARHEHLIDLQRRRTEIGRLRAALGEPLPMERFSQITDTEPSRVPVAQALAYRAAELEGGYARRALETIALDMHSRVTLNQRGPERAAS